MLNKKRTISGRFRGLLPIVIDVETSGLNPATDAILEIAGVVILMNEKGELTKNKTFHYHVDLFEGANVDPESLAITNIDPGHPFRFAIPEQQMLHNIFTIVKEQLELTGCKRAVLVGHNAWFDLAFLQAAIKRCKFETHPFHSFTSFDTATLSALVLGETVLAKAMRRAGLSFNVLEAHSALYDAERTAELFCYLVNNSSK